MRDQFFLSRLWRRDSASARSIPETRGTGGVTQARKVVRRRNAYGQEAAQERDSTNSRTMSLAYGARTVVMTPRIDIDHSHIKFARRHSISEGITVCRAGHPPMPFPHGLQFLRHRGVREECASSTDEPWPSCRCLRQSFRQRSRSYRRNPARVVCFAQFVVDPVSSGTDPSQHRSARRGAAGDGPSDAQLRDAHAAIYDAVKRHRSTPAPYLIRVRNATRSASQQAAAAAAAHGVLVALYPALSAQIDAQFDQSMTDVPDGAGRKKG